MSTVRETFSFGGWHRAPEVVCTSEELVSAIRLQSSALFCVLWFFLFLFFFCFFAFFVFFFCHGDQTFLSSSLLYFFGEKKHKKLFSFFSCGRLCFARYFPACFLCFFLFLWGFFLLLFFFLEIYLQIGRKGHLF